MSRPSNSPAVDAPVAIIGCGGIGSHFCSLLSWAIDTEQLPWADHSVTVYDPDVVDTANLKHQDYGDAHVGYPKCMVMHARYGFVGRCAKFGLKSHYAGVGTFILCADNPGVRLDVYKHCRTHNKAFLDMRCEGSNYLVMTDAHPWERLMASLGTSDEERKDETGRSCQLVEDRRTGRVQLGHLAATVAGMQLLLRRSRGEPFPSGLAASVL